MSDLPISDVRDPSSPSVRKAADCICSGGVVVLPTRCLYGLGADALNPDAVERVFEIKQRPKEKPILVLVHQMNQVERFVRRIPPLALRMMEEFWPGGVTLVFEAAPGVSPYLTAGTGRIGIRLCGHPVARSLAEAAGGPITGTSANLSGRPACADISRLDPLIAAAVDLVLDAGLLAGGVGSTVVDVTGDRIRILRDGAVPAARILAIV